MKIDDFIYLINLRISTKSEKNRFYCNVKSHARILSIILNLSKSIIKTKIIKCNCKKCTKSKFKSKSKYRAKFDVLN